jgi:hypothetical protein
VEFDEDDETIGGYYVNCAEVSKQNDLLAVTRMLAKDLQINTFMTVGDFMKSLSDDDLRILMEGSDYAENGEMLDDIMLIAMMLSTAEGAKDIDTLDDVHAMVNRFIGFLVVESLGRKKLVKVLHQNMSFDEDMGDKVIVERIE